MPPDGDRHGEALALYDLAETYPRKGDDDGARELVRAALAIEVPRGRHRSRVLFTLGSLSSRSGAPALSDAQFARAIDMAADASDLLGEAEGRDQRARNRADASAAHAR